MPIKQPCSREVSPSELQHVTGGFGYPEIGWPLEGGGWDNQLQGGTRAANKMEWPPKTR